VGECTSGALGGRPVYENLLLLVVATTAACALAMLPSSAAAAGPVALPTPPDVPRGASLTEAAWSPDGAKVAFQTETTKTSVLRVLDLATGAFATPYSGPGMALFPAWSPDGRWLVFCQAHFTRTAAQGLEHGYNLLVVPAAGGPARRLTDGVWRDYTPAFTPDGRYVYFSSTRGMKHNAVGLFRVAFAGGKPEPVVANDAPDVAYLSPTFSPDGKLLACAYLSGFRNNWAIRLIRTSDPTREYPLTDGRWPLYAPRWSPDGKFLAATGYRPGDPGWGVYIIEVATGRVTRLDLGPGNSRSPAWSPDGSELIFENNRTGTYRLYRAKVPSLQFHDQDEAPASPPHLVLHWHLDRTPTAIVRDLSGAGNDGQPHGQFARRAGGLVFDGNSWIAVEKPLGCDFGTGPFAVQVEFQLEQADEELHLLAVGDYPDSRQGWQVFLAKGYLWFNSRVASGTFVGARSDRPVPAGTRIKAVGLRRAGGRVELYINGYRQGVSGAGATMVYPVPNQVRLGSQFNGKDGFQGIVYDFRVYRGELPQSDLQAESLRSFLSGE